MARSSMEDRFEKAMYEIYDKAKRECGYQANRFLQMIRNRGGLEAARRLIKRSGPTPGFNKLAACGRLDLSVEAYALRPEFQRLFTPDELERARSRLEEYGYAL